MDSDTDSPEEQYMALSSVIASLSEEKQQAEARLKKLSDLGGSVYRVNHSKATSLEGELATPATRYHKLTSGWLGGRFKRPKKWWNRREIRKLDRDIEERTHALDSERYSVEYAQRGIQRISQELGISPDVSKGGVKSLEHETIGQIRTLDDRIQSAKVKKMGLSAQVYNLSEAHTVFGDRLYGPQHFYDVFGYDINPQDMPKLPTRTVMEKTRDLGAVLALRVYDTPLDRGKQRKSEWVMFLPRLHPDTVDRDYFEQTKVIRDYLQQEGLISDEELTGSSDERLSELRALAATEPERATGLMSQLAINQNHRHSPSDIIYFNRLLEDLGEDNFEATNADPNEYGGPYLPTHFVTVGKFKRTPGRGEDSGMRVDSSVDRWSPPYKQGVRIILGKFR